MSDHRPRFEELVDAGELDATERERLSRIHDLLVAAGPPPELSPTLLDTPEIAETAETVVVPFVRRYRFAALGLAAALALALFGAGYGIGRGTAGPDVEFTVPMSGPGGARASLAVFTQDAAGNWPMELRVTGLEALPNGHRYELWLTRDGKLVAQCGSFVVTGAHAEVPLNAPYRLRSFDGWVVVEAGNTDFVLETETV
ncbi:MAG: anti-sigma factor domain-containing protein [Gaiella sp.]